MSWPGLCVGTDTADTKENNANKMHRRIRAAGPEELPGEAACQLPNCLHLTGKLRGAHLPNGRFGELHPMHHCKASFPLSIHFPGL